MSTVCGSHSGTRHGVVPGDEFDRVLTGDILCAGRAILTRTQ